MLNLRKSAAFVLAMTSGVAMAGGMGGGCSANGVTIPCPQEAWGFGIYGLYLKPTFTNELAIADQVATFTTTATTSELSTALLKQIPSFEWGFKLEGSYNFNSGNDVNLNWSHLGKKTHTVTATGSFPIIAILGLQANFIGEDIVTVSPQWDAVNFELGQHVDFGEFQKLRFHGGVQYTRISANVTHDFTGTVTGSPPIPTITILSNSTHTYDGFGPRIMVDYSYLLGAGFSIYANGGTTLLIGSRKITISDVQNTNPLPIPTNLSSLSLSETLLVPELEAKIGLSYAYEMSAGTIIGDIGLSWLNYFNALNAAHQFNNLNFNPGDSNFALSGGYIGFKWLGGTAY